MYLIDFYEIRIYTLAHRKESHTLLSRYFIYAGVPEHIHSDNAWEVTNISKQKKVIDE